MNFLKMAFTICEKSFQLLDFVKAFKFLEECTP
jgi:hypothetical protein